VPYLRAASWPAALDDLRRQGYLLVALTPRSGAVPLSAFAATVAERVAILLGSEGFGLGEDTLAGADAHVRIPVDPRADSLNVVSAAAIALYALAPRLT
jgi:tRNA G18 (ribose-2'-O)-methylase SpoU